jgi:hypothetical protein
MAKSSENKLASGRRLSREIRIAHSVCIETRSGDQ